MIMDIIAWILLLRRLLSFSRANMARMAVVCCTTTTNAATVAGISRSSSSSSSIYSFLAEP